MPSGPYHRHPHVESRRGSPPRIGEGLAGWNGRIAVWLTRNVGTMGCAYLFALLALAALPEAIRGGLLPIVQWVSQTFIQLVMLSVIMVGQNLIGEAGDRRAELTYQDAEAAFHETEQIQRHLHDQDEILSKILARLDALEDRMSAGNRPDPEGS